MTQPALRPDACPMCADTRIDPRIGHAPRETLLYLEDTLHPSFFTELAERMRRGEQHIEVVVDVPPGGGIPAVEFTGRKRLAVKKGA